jgi:hypothetical protein
VFDRLVGKSQSKPTHPLAQTQAEQWWTEFAEYLKEALTILERIVSVRPPDPFEPGSDYKYMEQTNFSKLRIVDGMHSLSLADERLHKLQAVWPEKRKALDKLNLALAEYKTLFELSEKSLDMVNLDTERKKPGWLRQIVDQFKQHAAKGDKLLQDGLSQLGRSLEEANH